MLYCALFATKCSRGWQGFMCAADAERFKKSEDLLAYLDLRSVRDESDRIEDLKRVRAVLNDRKDFESLTDVLKFSTEKEMNLRFSVFCGAVKAVHKSEEFLNFGLITGRGNDTKSASSCLEFLSFYPDLHSAAPAPKWDFFEQGSGFGYFSDSPLFYFEDQEPLREILAKDILYPDDFNVSLYSVSAPEKLLMFGAGALARIRQSENCGSGPFQTILSSDFDVPDWQRIEQMAFGISHGFPLCLTGEPYDQQIIRSAPFAAMCALQTECDRRIRNVRPEYDPLNDADCARIECNPWGFFKLLVNSCGGCVVPSDIGFQLVTPKMISDFADHCRLILNRQELLNSRTDLGEVKHSKGKTL